MRLREGIKPPDDGTRDRAVAEGDRYEIARLRDGRVQLVLDRGERGVVMWAGPLSVVQQNAAIDASEADRAAILAYLSGEVAAPIGGR